MSKASQFCSLFLVPALAILGIDFSRVVDPIKPETFECFNSSAYSYAVIKGYQYETGNVDSNVVDNIFNARNAGLSFVDISFLPCVPYGTPAGQAAALVHTIREQEYRMIWVWVDIYAWNTNQTYNQIYLKTVVNQLKFLKQKVGIYSSPSKWERIVGKNFTEFSDLPLFYSSSNNTSEYNDFIPFGGWTSPFMKTFGTAKSICGMNVFLSSFNSLQKNTI